MEWTADGWLKLKRDAAPMAATASTEQAMALSDDFSGTELGLQWAFWKEYAPDALSFGQTGLTVKGKGKSPADGRLLTVTATDKSYEVETEIRLAKGATGGLVLFYDEEAFAGLASDGKDFIIYRDGKPAQTLRSDCKRHFHVRLLNRANRLSISVSPDGQAWKQLAERNDFSG